MKFVIAVLALIIPVFAQQDAYTIEQFQNVNPDGRYNHVYRTSNGISAEETGIGGQYARGSYNYVDENGQQVAVIYEADENGYRARSDAIPTPPPIPTYILRSLEFIRSSQNFNKKKK